MRAADGARERATRWQETAECEADGLEHWKSACESSKAALAALEKKVRRLEDGMDKIASYCVGAIDHNKYCACNRCVLGRLARKVLEEGSDE